MSWTVSCNFENSHESTIQFSLGCQIHYSPCCWHWELQPSISAHNDLTLPPFWLSSVVTRSLILLWHDWGSICSISMNNWNFPPLWGVPSMGGTPLSLDWFLLWKIPSFEMDDDWGHPYDSGNPNMSTISVFFGAGLAEIFAFTGPANRKPIGVRTMFIWLVVGPPL